MNNYQFRVSDCINDKIVKFSREEGKSLYNLEIYYKYQMEQVSLMYRNPKEHLSKIMVIAYNNTIKEMQE